MEKVIILEKEIKKLPKVEIEKTSVQMCPEVAEMEHIINSVKYDNELLALFMALLVTDDVVGSQLEQHFADYFGSQGMMKEN